ncbi:hypothetical protein OG799_12220 [Micromonospora sp. NBC_00898]|uniref:hypothetical protein n=1 Tax=Micromonospora sp. NBC_00898 TaxID=2975981 RepID=UPI0038638422|nr:hypothetical protein OG799_12220 [Micromonospora sp. NBC_00898]
MRNQLVIRRQRLGRHNPPSYQPPQQTPQPPDDLSSHGAGIPLVVSLTGGNRHDVTQRARAALAVVLAEAFHQKAHPVAP